MTRNLETSELLQVATQVCRYSGVLRSESIGLRGDLARLKKRQSFGLDAGRRIVLWKNTDSDRWSTSGGL